LRSLPLKLSLYPFSHGLPGAIYRVVTPTCRSHSRTAFATDFPNVTYHRCYDGDTCTFSIPGVHPLFGEKISVRIAGIDTPEIKGKCQQEKVLATEARDVVRRTLEKAQRIDLIDAKRGKYSRIVARVLADGKDVAEVLFKHSLAVGSDGGTKTKQWCAGDLSHRPPAPVAMLAYPMVSVGLT